MNINPVKTQPVSDDPELAKVLAGVNGAADDGADEDETLQYEGLEAQMPEMPVEEPVAVVEEPAPVAMPSYGGLDLDTIKNHALEDLRPLVDKLTVSNEEKFDIYLLLLRSSDDNSLIEPAYNSARMIEDETKRANALLDVIKEVDYFKSRQ